MAYSRDLPKMASVALWIEIAVILNRDRDWRYGMVWYDLVWFGMIWYDLVLFGTVWYGLVWFGMHNRFQKSRKVQI